MEQGNLTSALFIDLKRAFDTLPHKGLLRKLKRDGITDISMITCQTGIKWYTDR